MSSVAAELKVRGVVQGVGYRYFCYRSALNLNLTGWARNNPDGSVGAWVEGERGAVEQFIDDIKAGPRHAAVTDVQVNWKEFTGKFSGFDITY